MIGAYDGVRRPGNGSLSATPSGTAWSQLSANDSNGAVCALGLSPDQPHRRRLFFCARLFGSCFASIQSFLGRMPRDESLALAASGGTALHFRGGLFITVRLPNCGMVIRKGEPTCPRPLPV